MKTICKFPLDVTDRQLLTLPQDSQILSVIVQNGTLMLYVLLETEKNSVCEKEIEIYGTGHPVSQDGSNKKFIGTVQQNQFVWHIFEKL